MKAFILSILSITAVFILVPDLYMTIMFSLLGGWTFGGLVFDLSEKIMGEKKDAE